jgi:tripartite-type tricarboxylate transporter receptor subunit TctC
MIASRRVALASLLAAAITLGVSAPTPALAQAAYPNKPIQLVIPYPPGGSDVLARKLVIGMSQALGQTIVVVNKPGASTQVASAFVAAAAPDGYTLYFANPGELAAGPSFFKSIPFNALTDFTLISYVADAPFVLVVSNEFPAKTVPELVTYAKANPDKVKFGSYGVQSQPDIAGRRFNLAYDTKAPIIPYQGGAPSLNAIVRNEVQLLFPTLIASRPFIVNGQMRPLAIAAEQRVPLYPDVPTFRELGVDLVDAASFGLMGPKGLPPEIVKRLNEVLLDELKKPEIKAYLDSLGIVPVGSTPEGFASRLKTMTDYWTAQAPKLGVEKQ